ncbi:hypothetical protein [Salipiger sp. CCB-MM3]|uniref:hypothetical protein n=1 Tax=Salipiger sp. CCB-MM3 TaxID=1792508 RepID=UPI00187DB8B4|nr:hypothetical protein [Salipiger sp. CCB-MM3]
MQPRNRFANYQPRKGLAGRFFEKLGIQEFLWEQSRENEYALAFLSGKTGIGKTAFLEDIRAEMKQERLDHKTEWAVGHVDFKDPERRTPERALAQIRVSLASEHLAAFPCFDAALAILFKESNPHKDIQEEYPRIYNSQFNEIGDELLSWVGDRELVKETMGDLIGEIPGAKFLKSTVLKLAEAAVKKIKTHDVKVDLARLQKMPNTQIRELLPDILALDIQRLKTRRPELTIAFMVDSLEQLGDDQWLRDLIQETKGTQWIISGKEIPAWEDHGFDNVTGLLTKLHPVYDHEVETYLEDAGIVDETAKRLIVKISSGFPPHFELLKNRYLDYGGDKNRLVALKAMGEAATSEIDPLVFMSATERNRLGLLSLVMPIDEETYNFLKIEYPSYVGAADWETFSTSSQICERAGGMASVTDEVREALLRDFEGREPKICERASGQLEKHFAERVEAAEVVDQTRLRIMQVQILRYTDPRGYRNAYKALAEDFLADRDFSSIKELRERQAFDAANSIWNKPRENERIREADLYGKALNLWLDAKVALSMFPPQTRDAYLAWESLHKLVENSSLNDPALRAEMGILTGDTRALTGIGDLAAEVATKAQLSGPEIGIEPEKLAPVRDLEMALCGRDWDWDGAIMAAGKVHKLGLPGDVQTDIEDLLKILRQREFRVSQNCLDRGSLERYVVPRGRQIVLSGPDEYYGEPRPVVMPALDRIKKISNILGDGASQKFEIALMQAEAKRVKEDYVRAESAYMRAYDIAGNDMQRLKALQQRAHGIAITGDNNFAPPRLKALAVFASDEGNDLPNDARADSFQKITDMRLKVGHHPRCGLGDLDRALRYARWAPDVTHELCANIINQSMRTIRAIPSEPDQHGIDYWKEQIPYLTILRDDLAEGGASAIQSRPRTREEVFAKMERDRQIAEEKAAQPEETPEDWEIRF